MTDTTTKSAIAYRNRLSGGPDQIVFFVVFVLGAGGIWFMKEWGVEQYLVTAAPLALMVVYFGYVCWSPRFRLREDQAGDSLYYLGFLYTLTSLAHSLFVFGSDEGSTEKIIANFGIALLTTILGLVFRVVLTQMRQDPVDFEREARAELGEAVTKLRAELETSVLELNGFRRATSQSLAEGMTEMGKLSTALLDDQGARLTKLVETTVARLDDGYKTLKESGREITDATGRTVKAVERLVGRIEAVSIPQDLLEARLAPVLTTITESAAVLERNAAAQGATVERLTTLVGKALESARLLDERLAASAEATRRQRDGLDSDVAALRETVESLAGAIREASAGIEESAQRQREALATLSGSAAEHLKSAERHRADVEAEVARSRELVGELHQALVSMTRTLTETLDGR